MKGAADVSVREGCRDRSFREEQAAPGIQQADPRGLAAVGLHDPTGPHRFVGASTGDGEEDDGRVNPTEGPERALAGPRDVHRAGAAQGVDDRQPSADVWVGDQQ